MVIFFAFVVVATFMGKLPVAVPALYLGSSFIAYFIYALDK
ncbi:MAG: hypothetical protein PHD37_04035 [Gallionellaceae bacterium]|nr:hypothetical protein [Gallionellaceae bacterium]